MSNAPADLRIECLALISQREMELEAVQDRRGTAGDIILAADNLRKAKAWLPTIVG